MTRRRHPDHAPRMLPGLTPLAVALVAVWPLLSVVHAQQRPPLAVNALPTNPRVNSGQAVISKPAANQMLVNQATSRAIYQWDTFNIGAKAGVEFRMPSASGSALNRVSSGSSRIDGALKSNGQLFLINLLFTISTAEGGFVILMEDVIISPDHRGQGYGTKMVEYVKDFARRRDFRRITLLTDSVSEESQRFFEKNGFVKSHMVPMRLLFVNDAAP